MNRIQSWPVDTLEPNTPPAIPALSLTLQKENSRSPDSDLSGKAEQHFSLFAPLHYEAGYGYPLIVWLHGPNDDERQLHNVMPHISLRNYVAAAPRGVCEPNPGLNGFQWRQIERSIRSTEKAVFDNIELACERYNVNHDRIFLGGLQCGGTMAMRIALMHPERFAGALSIGGPFPSNYAPLAGYNRSRRLPLFIAYGRDSECYPAERTCEELRLFHAAAMKVDFRQYPCADDLTTQMLRDANTWMMERINEANV